MVFQSCFHMQVLNPYEIQFYELCPLFIWEKKSSQHCKACRCSKLTKKSSSANNISTINSSCVHWKKFRKMQFSSVCVVLHRRVPSKHECMLPVFVHFTFQHPNQTPHQVQYHRLLKGTTKPQRLIKCTFFLYCKADCYETNTFNYLKQSLKVFSSICW